MCYSFIKKQIQKSMPSRQEGTAQLKLFNLEDYPDMKGERFELISNGLLLRGYKYFIDKKNIKAVIIFHHGMGAGHNAYEELIHNCVKHGYLVYAYDNACCGDSEGEGWWNFASSLIDQENFFRWFENDEDQKGHKRIVMGHSWGGFTAINGLRYQVDKIVAISAFNDIVSLLTETIKPLKIMTPLLKGMQKHYYGEYGNANCYKLLQSSNIPVLLIHGEYDDAVNYQKNFLRWKNKLAAKKNITFYTVKERYHQPYTTKESQMYYRYLVGLINEGKTDNFPEVDYHLLLEQDFEVLNIIFNYIDE